jgi:four helix bundle protein
LPKSEQFLLVDQMKRASRAVPALISEGYAKKQSIKEFKKYLRDALGESNEMINHLTFAKEQSYLSSNQVLDLLQRYQIVGKKLYSLESKWQQF